MSDQKLQDVKDHVKKAYEAMLDFLKENANNSEYRNEFIKDCHDTSRQLLILKNKLGA